MVYISKQYLAFAKYCLDIWLLVLGCSKSLFVALRAKLYFERHIIFEISRSEISKMMCLSKQSWGCVKSIFMALRAKLYFDRHMI